MATVYNVEIVSHWVNYSKEELQKILEKAIKSQKEFDGNEVQITVK